MTDPFVRQSTIGTPAWSSETYESNTFAPLSSTGFEVITGGYGEGGYGEGGYGDNTETISVTTDLNTTWESFTDR